MKKITKIVLTGGPCAGKTTAMTWIQNAFTSRGYKVLFVPEVATELINGGVAPWTCGTNADFQVLVYGLMMNKEEAFYQAATTMPEQKILIVCDRGLMDNKAYMTDEEFEIVMQRTNLNPVTCRDRYDGVFHLVTAANGNPEIYEKNCAGNPARYETIEQAVDIDNKLIASWMGHPHLRVIDNTSDFDNKMRRLIAEIAVLLGEPQPCETERKFLIEYPDLAALEKMNNCRKVEIIQSYLRTTKDEEVRIRQRGCDGHYIYYKTTKKRLTPTTRVEVEERLSQREYLTLLMDADTSMHQIRKNRYCLIYKGQYLEIDVYPFWKDKAILEIELVNEDQEYSIPDSLKVIKEITEDESYSNVSLAKATDRQLQEMLLS